MAVENLIKTFLPPQTQKPAPPPSKTPPPRNGANGGAKRHSPRMTPDQILRRDRDLGTYGHQLVDRIYRDYDSQIEVWKGAFGDVTAAFATAVGSRDRTLELARLERQTDAAFDALILGLLVGGAMHFLNAYLQYTVLPKIKLQRHTYKWNHTNWVDGLPEMTKVALPPAELGKIQLSTFGGIAEEMGNRLIPLAFPPPSAPSQPPDNWDGVWRLKNDFDKLIGESKQLVLGQFRDVQKWMTDKTEFGAAWAAYADDDEELARVMMRRHLDKLQNEWAKQWQFFGTTPRLINLNLLAEKYERSLWAGYLITALKDVAKLLAASKSGGRYTGDYLVRKALEDAIVDKLKQLNVVKPGTLGELFDQSERKDQGSPEPEVDVDGSVDRYREAVRLTGWAETYLKNVRGETEREFFPPAKTRTPPPL